MNPKQTDTEPAVILYVSCDGNDTWSGSLPEPNDLATDGPLATLEGARDAVRQIKRNGGLPAGGVRVHIQPGCHQRTGPFDLEQADSGTAEAPIVYSGDAAGAVRIRGGVSLTNWQPVTDAAVLERLHPQARQQVLRADLRAAGITDFGRLRSRGFGRDDVPSHMELFVNGRPMTLARWPNDDFVRITDIVREGATKDGHGQEIGKLEDGFVYEGDRPRGWKSVEGVWIHGYWAWDWANSYEAVESIDPETGVIRTREPYGLYGFRRHQRFYFLNVLEELDAPGEYYVDTRRGILYFWPPRPVEESEIAVSVLEAPMVRMQDVSHVTFRNLVFELTRGWGIQMSGGTGNRIADCTLRDIGSNAIVIEGGTEHEVSGCELCYLGDGGVKVSGGDRKTLTPGRHAVISNHIHHYARWSRCYKPAIMPTGVGLRVAHNLIHHSPHTGILFNGNDMMIEFNEIHHVTLETGDCGAIYTGRDFTARGNVIRYNYIHDTGGFGMGSMAVYLDDCSSGQTIFGNIFRNVTRAAFIGGGVDNVVENNIFIDCEPAVHVDGRGVSDGPVWRNMIKNTMRERLDAMNYHQPPYSERYPELLKLDALYEEEMVPPLWNVIRRNICLGGTWTHIVWGAEPEHLTIEDNLVDEDPLFVDVENEDYRLQEGSPALALGFEQVPVDKIGPQGRE